MFGFYDGKYLSKTVSTTIDIHFQLFVIPMYPRLYPLNFESYHRVDN